MKNIRIMKHQFEHEAKLGREPSITGFIEDVRWVPSAYGSPSVLREYRCSNGDGKTYKMWCTGGNKTAGFIVDLYMHCDHWDNVVIKFDGRDEKPTLEELMQLARKYDVWYTEDVWCEDCESETIYTICEPPKYWLQDDPVGPIDNDIDQYEVEITNDLDKAHRSDFEREELMKQEEAEINAFADEVVCKCTTGRRFHKEFPSEKVADVIFQAMRKAGLI